MTEILVQSKFPRTKDPKDTCAKSRCCRREFAQQTMRYNQFYVKPMCFGVTYVCIGVLLLIIGATFNTDATTVAYSTAASVYKFGECEVSKKNAPCVHSVDIDWKGPTNTKVFLYYRLDGFFQSHRAFVMNGIFTASQEYVRTDSSYNTQFSDNFQVWDGASAMVVDTSKVSYPSDYDFFINPFTDDSADWNKFEPVEGGGEYATRFNPSFAFCRTQGRCNCRNESCLVWRKSAPSPNVRKLYGTIEKGFPKEGKYKVYITNSYDSSAWGVTKSLQLQCMGSYGGVESTTFAASLSMLVGLICVAMAASCCGVAVLGKRDVDEYVKSLRDPERRKQILDSIRQFKS